MRDVNMEQLLASVRKLKRTQRLVLVEVMHPHGKISYEQLCRNVVVRGISEGYLRKVLDELQSIVVETTSNGVIKRDNLIWRVVNGDRKVVSIEMDADAYMMSEEIIREMIWA